MSQCYLLVVDVLPVDEGEVTVAHDLLSIVWTPTQPAEGGRRERKRGREGEREREIGSVSVCMWGSLVCIVCCIVCIFVYSIVLYRMLGSLIGRPDSSHLDGFVYVVCMLCIRYVECGVYRLLGSLMSRPDSRDLASDDSVRGNLMSSIRMSSNSFSWSWL